MKGNSISNAAAPDGLFGRVKTALAYRQCDAIISEKEILAIFEKVKTGIYPPFPVARMTDSRNSYCSFRFHFVQIVITLSYSSLSRLSDNWQRCLYAAILSWLGLITDSMLSMSSVSSLRLVIFHILHATQFLHTSSA